MRQRETYKINRERKREDYEANRDYILARKAKWYEENRETILARLREYHRANPEKARVRQQRRRALKAGAEGSFTPEELKALYESYDYRCLRCGDRDGDVKNGKLVKLTHDHIRALKRGGSNYIDNIQPLCGSCNSSKGYRHATDYRPMWRTA